MSYLETISIDTYREILQYIPDESLTNLLLEESTNTITKSAVQDQVFWKERLEIMMTKRLVLPSIMTINIHNIDWKRVYFNIKNYDGRSWYTLLTNTDDIDTIKVFFELRRMYPHRMDISVKILFKESISYNATNLRNYIMDNYSIEFDNEFFKGVNISKINSDSYRFILQHMPPEEFYGMIAVILKRVDFYYDTVAYMMLHQITSVKRYFLAKLKEIHDPSDEDYMNMLLNASLSGSSVFFREITAKNITSFKDFVQNLPASQCLFIFSLLLQGYTAIFKYLMECDERFFEKCLSVTEDIQEFANKVYSNTVVIYNMVKSYFEYIDVVKSNIEPLKLKYKGDLVFHASNGNTDKYIKLLQLHDDEITAEEIEEAGVLVQQ